MIILWCQTGMTVLETSFVGVISNCIIPAKTDFDIRFIEFATYKDMTFVFERAAERLIHYRKKLDK